MKKRALTILAATVMAASILTGCSGVADIESDAKISESSHYYITDYYRALANQDPEVCRMLIDGKIYDVQWIDDPMGMHEHLEIYLKAVGGVGSGTD